MSHVDLLYGLPGCSNAVAIDVSSADATLAPPSRCLYVGTGGTVKVDMVGTGTGVSFTSVANGTYLNVRASKIYHTGTNAAAIVSLS